MVLQGEHPLTSSSQATAELTALAPAAANKSIYQYKTKPFLSSIKTTFSSNHGGDVVVLGSLSHTWLSHNGWKGWR